MEEMSEAKNGSRGVHWRFVLQELVDKVVAFQEEAQEALTAEVPDSRQVEKLIDIGITLDVDLPEIPRLKQVCCLKWG